MDKAFGTWKDALLGGLMLILTDHGKSEAKHAGQLIKELNIEFDVLFHICSNESDQYLRDNFRYFE